MRSGIHLLNIVTLGIVSFHASNVLAGNRLLDEARIGVSSSIQAKSTYEAGMFPSVTLFFDPFDAARARKFTDIMLSPRIHAGAIVSTSGAVSQLYAGFNWTFAVTERFFVDLGLGGTVHNGETRDDSSRGPKLGCNVMFHEYLAAGYALDENWRLLATVEHSSNANMCDVNDGLSYAGLSVGYKF